MNNMIIEEDIKKIVDNVDFSRIADKTVLIVGGTGLIGTYFIYSIIEARKKGYSVKKLSITHLNPLPKYLDTIRSYEWIELLQGDLSDKSFVETLGMYDIVIHLAGYGQPAQFSLDPIKTIKLNTTLTMDLCERILPNGFFLFASSSGIYNGLKKASYTEEDVGTTNTLHPRACYYEGKKCGEVIVNSYREKGLNAKSVRLSYTYGPAVRQTDERALYSFIKKGLKGRIDLLDDGSAQRIYCYVADAVELMWKILLFGNKPIYNVGGIEETTILNVASIIAQLLNVQVHIPDVNNPVVGNHVVERVDMSMTLNEFPMDYIPLEEGLRRTLDWYKAAYCLE